MRSAIQANRGQAGILQGLPAETPETPVLNSKILFFFSSYSASVSSASSASSALFRFTRILYHVQPHERVN
jgi:hypothetical protein